MCTASDGNYTSTSSIKLLHFTGQAVFLTPNKQYQSTEGKCKSYMYAETDGQTENIMPLAPSEKTHTHTHTPV